MLFSYLIVCRFILESLLKEEEEDEKHKLEIKKSLWYEYFVYFDSNN